MTTTAKGKEKTLPSPRLIPRATAASAARAAHNANSRSNQPNAIKQSLSRSNAVVPNKHGKPSAQNVQSDSNSEVQINSSPKFEQFSNVHKAPLLESENFVIDSPLTVSQEPSHLQPACEANIVNVSSNQNKLPERSMLVKLGSNSRPQTPKSRDSSKPQTPHIPSRPVTPLHPMQRHGTPTSRPNTPLCANNAAPKTPTQSVPPSSRVSVTSSERALNEDDIKSAYTEKQNQFHSLKRELDLKQRMILEVFDALRALRERMLSEGVTGCGEGLQLNELEVYNVADWTSEEINQLCRDATVAADTDGAISVINNTTPIDESTLVELDAKVLNVPTHFADLCLQAFTARQEVIDWVKDLIEKDENGSGEYLERIAKYNNHGLELCEALRVLKAHADNAVDTMRHIAKRALHERSALISVGESLVREIARLRQEVETHTSAIKELQQSRNKWNRNIVFEDLHRETYDERALCKQDMYQELEEERVGRTVTKEKLATTESQLRQARMRISKMDRQLREAEASITGLTSTVKSLEDQSRQKEVQLEARARKLKESLRTAELANTQITQQRNALQTDVQELKGQIETMTAQHKAQVSELNNKIKETQVVLEEQHKKAQSETKEKSEATLMEAEKIIKQLNDKITALESIRPADLPSEREIDLWAELQATKDTLRIAEDEITASKREKVKFLETLTKITESDNKAGLQQKLAAELINKEEIMGKLQIQIRDLTKTIKLNEQKVMQYEQYVRDFQEHARAIVNSEPAPNGVTYQDLQQEVMNLKLNLLEAVHRNEQLSEQLMQNEQQIEQQEKTSRAQARVIKVREELINMLKNKETEQSRELASLQQDLEHRMKIVEEVNKQIAAKAEEIQELFATLENKQQQIHRLEKIVLALEEQQKRAQAQRTRHEEKIATLEHELAASGNRREKKFLFF